MDKTDVLIVREFLQGEPLLTILPARSNYRPSLKRLAVKLRLAESTVRERYRKLAPFFSEWSLMLNPGLVGVRMGGIELELTEDCPKEEAFEKLKLVEGIFMLIGYAGSRMAALLFYHDDNDLRRKSMLAEELTNGRLRLSTEIPFPPCMAKLSRTDLRVIANRQGDMTSSTQATAREMRVSGKTVKRRLTKLSNELAVFSVAALNHDALQEWDYSHLTVEYQESESRERTGATILSILEEHLVAYAHCVNYDVFNLMTPNMQEAKRIVHRVNGLKGVKMAEVGFVEERRTNLEMLREQVQMMMARVP